MIRSFRDKDTEAIWQRRYVKKLSPELSRLAYNKLVLINAAESAKDRNRQAWHLALAGLRRGEIAGLRWDDVDLGQRTVRIGKTRVDVGGRALDQDDPRQPRPDGCCPYLTRS